MKGILNLRFLGPLRPLFKYAILKLSLRSTSEAAVDLIEMAVGGGVHGNSGCFCVGTEVRGCWRRGMRESRERFGERV